MSAAVIPLIRAMSEDDKKAILAQCWAVLGGEYDPLRVVWDEQATCKDRKLLLAMAGRSAGRSKDLAGRSWLDIPNNDRVAIAGGLRRFSAWAERLK